jgi:hypothetical protein
MNEILKSFETFFTAFSSRRDFLKKKILQGNVISP